MKLFLVLLALGLASIPWFPAEWRLALVVGWAPAMFAEALLARRRLAVLGLHVSSHQFLSVLVFGFLGRLSLIFLGAILGAKSGLYPEGPFLAAFLAAIFVGEVVSLPRLSRASRRHRPAVGLSHENHPPT